MTDKEALIERLATTCHGLDSVDPLRLLVDDVIAALREPEQEPVAVYGFCPECGAKGVQRERRPDGNDKCAKGHTYPSSKATTAPQSAERLHDPLPRACNLAGVDYQTFLKIKAYMPVYDTHPPQRTWVGLTDDERKLLWAEYGYRSAMCKPFTQAVEAKLKEKNA